MFTDLVASTEFMARVGDEVANTAMREHDAAVSRAITANRGQVVKSMGDGVMAIFDGAADAVAAAVAVQQATVVQSARLGHDLRIRVGISVGDVVVEPNDVHGTAVHEASRLCDAAQGEQILVADLVRALARGRGGFVFESYGEVSLRGIPDPVPACIVNWERPQPVDTHSLPFPPMLAPTTQNYIGRDDLRSQLTAIWATVRDGSSRTVLLAGEPGIGKTRTAGEVAREATSDGGAIVLYGRCDDAMQVPYQPFVEMLDHQTEHSPDLPLGRLPGDLTRLLADLDRRVPGLPPATSSDARTEEHRLFEAVASWITTLARTAPVVLVVDDLHWAARPTLQMLMHLVRHAASDPSRPRLLVLGTYRDTDIDRSHPLSQVMGDLRRISGVERIPVQPLSEAEVLAFIENAAGHELEGAALALARRAFAETEGNPFFLSEVLRHLIESGVVHFQDGRWTVTDDGDIHVPEGVRDVIGQRLSKLPVLTNDLLRAAAVIGRDFDLDLLLAVTEADDDEAVDALDHAVRARLIQEMAADRFRFEHALVQTTLTDELSASRRRRLHRRITDRLVLRGSVDLASVAHHAVEAGPQGGSLLEAIGHVLAAADHAGRVRATADAETLYRKALELLEEDEIDSVDPIHLRARLGLGLAQRDQGSAVFRDTLLGVATDARKGDETAFLIRAVQENTRGFSSIIGGLDRERVDLLEVALRVDQLTDLERAEIEATLSSELAFDPDCGTRARDLAARAVERTLAVGDDRVRASVLVRTFFPSLVPDRWREMRAHALDGVAAADRSGDPNLRVLAMLDLQFAEMSAGNLGAAAAANREATRIARADAGPFAVWTAVAGGAQFLLIDGELDRSIEMNDLSLAMGQECGAVDAVSWWGGCAVNFSYFRDAEVGDPDLLEGFADSNPLSPVWRCSVASSSAIRGDHRRARAVLDQYGLRRLDRIPRDCFWFVACFHLALAARELDDRELAEDLASALAPFSGFFSHYLIGPNVPVDSILGSVHGVLGDWEPAVRFHESAYAYVCAQFPMAIPPGADALAGALEARGWAGDRERAAAVRAEALDRAERYGATGWAERLRAGTGPVAGSA